MNFINTRIKYDYKANLSLNNYIFFIFLILTSVASIISILGNIFTNFPWDANIKWGFALCIAFIGFEILRTNKFVEIFKTSIFCALLAFVIMPSWFYGGGDNSITLLYLLLITIQSLMMFEKMFIRLSSIVVCTVLALSLNTITYLHPQLIESTGIQNVHIDNLIQLCIIFVTTAVSVGIFTRRYSQQHEVMLELNSSLDVLASIDVVSGIMNRRKILEILETCVNSETPYYNHLVMMDIDHFKHINDNYGHLAGDDVIKHFATYMQDTIEICGVAGRYGGDEFMALLNCSDSEAEIIAKHLVQVPDFNDITVTTSAGMTPIASNSALDKLIFQVDSLLYTAKENGRNQIALLNGQVIKP